MELSTETLANQATGYQHEETQVTVFNGSPTEVMEQMTSVVRSVAQQIDNANFIADIRGKKYPKVEWWTTIGASLGLFPVVVWSKRIEREDEVAYESRVEVRRQGQLITSGEALCSSTERSWKGRDEYAIKSMSITRATGKAYRIGLSMIAVMSGLEGTPAEEMPVDAPVRPKTNPPARPQQPRKPDNSAGRTNTTPAEYNAPKDEKPWLNRTLKNSTRLTEEWVEVEEKLGDGTWSVNDVTDRYKVSNHNRIILDRMVKADKRYKPDQDQEPLPFK